MTLLFPIDDYFIMYTCRNEKYKIIDNTLLCCAVVNNDMHAVPVIHTTISSVYSTANIANGLISSPLN